MLQGHVTKAEVTPSNGFFVFGPTKGQNSRNSKLHRDVTMFVCVRHAMTYSVSLPFTQCLLG